MAYDGTGSISEAVAALYGLSPKSSAQIAGLIKLAKDGLGITSKSKRLPDNGKLAIYRWHYEHLSSVQNVKQRESSESGALQSVADGVIGNSQPIGESQALPAANAVQNVKQNVPATFANDDRDNLRPDDYGQVHFAVTFSHQGQPKRTTVMLEGYFVKALQRKHGMDNNAAIRAWIEQAIKADGVRFDSAMPLTKQVKRMMIESFV
ncbi:MAG: hypothetical protein PHH59_05345 [Methylovulum sp.]|uniref:hypothetical protein n=1 Tax=Methylovulum sp. TaxID=1916980 RepID=UPI002601D680|nr:hypothetical protein [Methylovulum sp.]MDD2723437.1 hypothetical protein [Methylovulum sp.]MDD5125303.1 hypothetical protein [Methylovulum sp.]